MLGSLWNPPSRRLLHYEVTIHAVVLSTGGLMHSSWLSESTDTEFRNTSAIFDLLTCVGLFAGSCWFLSIPVHVPLLSIVLASFCFLLQWGDEQPANSYVPAKAINLFSGLPWPCTDGQTDKQTWKSRSNCRTSLVRCVCPASKRFERETTFKQTKWQ